MSSLKTYTYRTRPTRSLLEAAGTKQSNMGLLCAVYARSQRQAAALLGISVYELRNHGGVPKPRLEFDGMVPGQVYVTHNKQTPFKVGLEAAGSTLQVGVETDLDTADLWSGS